MIDHALGILPIPMAIFRHQLAGAIENSGFSLKLH
jgi:hypothetical protein